MKKLVLALTISFQLYCGTPSPQLTPENGCEFATAVLVEVFTENERIAEEMKRATQARKVVLVVQQKSGSNLREGTLTWMRQNCSGSSSGSPRGTFSSDSSSGSASGE